MPIRRRRLLALGAASLAGAALPWSLSRARAAAGTAKVAACKTLICVHLRGGADGLSMLVPYGDAMYYRARKHTAVAAPGSLALASTALDLDGHFGLHPRLAVLAPLFGSGELALWPAVGWAARESSHAHAERRLRATLQTLAGSRGALWMSERGAQHATLDLAAQLEHIAQQVEAGVAPPLAFAQSSGWDVHAAQGGAGGGRMARSLESLAAALAALRARLYTHWDDVAVAVVSEFGRAVVENATSGTDDGHASAVFLLGGRVSGGRVHGRWPGLTSASGLTPTTDMQELLAQLVPA